MSTTIKNIIGGLIIIVIMMMAWKIGNQTSAALKPICTTDEITIKSMRAKWVDSCRTRNCIYLKGVAVLSNNCPSATGVQVKIVGYDKQGNPVATRDLWPASINNIPPGDFTFTLDGFLDYDKSITNFKLEPIAVKTW